MKLRSLIKAAKPDNNNTAVSKSAIFVCFDGGFVIGKQQQMMLATQVVKMILKIDDVITPSGYA